MCLCLYVSVFGEGLAAAEMVARPYLRPSVLVFITSHVPLSYPPPPPATDGQTFRLTSMKMFIELTRYATPGTVRRKKWSGEGQSHIGLGWVEGVEGWTGWRGGGG